MSLPVAFRDAASAEFVEATAWYESKRSGLGLKFITEIERCLSLAAESPLQFPEVRDDVRRAVANRFPYAVYFRAEKNGSLSSRFSIAGDIPASGEAGLSSNTSIKSGLLLSAAH